MNSPDRALVSRSRLWVFVPTSLRQHRLPLFTFLAIPLGFALIQRDWLYTPIGNLDPWYNVGFFLHYTDPAFYADHYKGSRLSWLAPGFALYSIFTPRLANFILHVGALVTATSFVYLTLARLVGREVAFIVGVLLTFYFPFYGVGGWDYQTTPSGAYYALTLYSLTRAAQSDCPNNWLIAAGAAFAATFHADIIFINLVPVLIAHYFVVGPAHRSWRDAITAGLFTLSGFVGLTSILCVVAWSTGRSFLFFWPIVEIVFRYVGDPSNMSAWWQPWSSLWFLSPGALGFLAIPTATLLISLAWLGAKSFRRPASHLAPVRLLLVGQFAFVGLLWIFWQSIGHVALDPEYFAYPIIIPAFLAIGGLAAQKDGPLARVAVVALAIFLLVVGAGFCARCEISRSNGGVLLIFSAVAIVLILVCVFSTAWLRSALVAASMGVFVFLYIGLRSSLDPWRFGNLTSSLNCVQAERSFDQIVALNQLFRRFEPVWWKTWFWAGPRETISPTGCPVRLDDFRGSLISTGMSGLGAISDRTASDITDESVGFVTFGGFVGALVADPSLLGGLIERFQKAGKVLELVYKEQLQVSGVPATLALYRVNSPTRP